MRRSVVAIRVVDDAHLHSYAPCQREREEKERERGEKRETCQVHLHDRYTTSHRVKVEAKALLRARQATFDAGRRARAAEAPLSS